MKRQALLLAGLCFAICLCAQPTITEKALIQLGESAPVQFVVPGNFNPGPSGADVNWDFSQVQNDALSFEWKALPPMESPFADSFPSANVAFRFPLQGSNGENWLYYEYTEQHEVLLQGVASLLFANSETDTLFAVLNENPELEFKAPFSYQEEVSDQFAGFNHVIFQGQRFVLRRTGSTTLRADAYGTLHTPAGTFVNVLRIRTQEDLVDEFMGIPNEQHIVRYSWFSPDQKYLLYHTDSIAQQQFGGSTQVTFSTFYRSGAATTGFGQEVNTAIGLRAFPNPTSGQIQVEFELARAGRVQLLLRNIIGQALRSQSVQAAAGRVHQSLSLHGLAPGHYLLEVHTPAGIAHQPIQLTR